MRILFLMLLLSNCFYLGAQDFENNFAWKRVRVKDKFGCVRENGDTIIKPKYKTIEPCYDLAEFAVATTADGRTILVQVGGQEYNYAATFAELSPKTEAFILTEERSLRSVIKKAPNLKILVFYTQYVSEIPKEIEQLTQLTYLKAMHWGELQSLDNILVSIHANIGKLKKLKHLNLDIPNAASIPEEIGKLSSLEDLYLHTNLEELPKGVMTLKNLKRLVVKGKKMHLPESMCRLAKLKKLSLYFNKIAKLSDNFGDLGALELLDLSQNELQTLPKSIGKLSNLHTLIVRDNKDFTAFPQEFWQCRNLQYLDAYHTNLSIIPSEIGAMRALKSLNFSLCSITELPQSLCELQQLEYLNIGTSMFEQKTPIDFTCLKNLSVLFTPFDMKKGDIEALAKKMPQVIMNPEGANGVWGSEWD